MEERRQDLVDRMNRFEKVNREDHQGIHKRLDKHGEKLDEIAVAIAEARGWTSSAKMFVLAMWAALGTAVAVIGNWWKGDT